MVWERQYTDLKMIYFIYLPFFYHFLAWTRKGWIVDKKIVYWIFPKSKLEHYMDNAYNHESASSC